MKKNTPNHLIKESSPYLLQHAYNPVNWYPWSEEALQNAVEHDKVILVSIGYSACHWCHVMERESFENEDTAALMNEHFINIKIDREERPDLDQIYMDAVQAISGSGGWPLNVFLTPATKPFYGGTYFPPVKAFNRSSWQEVLLAISDSWKNRRNEIESQADNLLEHIKSASNFSINQLNLGNDNYTINQCKIAFENVMKTADREWGGFGKAPKFPQTFTIQFLLQYYHYSNNSEALQQALLSIDKMLDGGIYDHIAGGLARYSTDNEWLAPHFEKMLYDNALLIIVLCDAFQITRNEKYQTAIDKTIAFVIRELMHKKGGFYAALDADSDGEEGKYYVWQKNEIETILQHDSEVFCDFFNVTEQGNWEATNILRVLQPLDQFAVSKNIDKEELQLLLEKCLEKLSVERNKRTKPSLDDKIILSWNTLVLKAIAKAGIVLENPDYVSIATNNFNFITDNFRANDATFQMMHTWKNNEAKYPAFLDDYANLIDACLKLYEATFDKEYLVAAKNYCEYVIENFGDEDGIFFYFTNVHQLDIVIRKKEIYDGAVPSGNSIMAANLLYLSKVFNNSIWAARVEKMVVGLGAALQKYPGSFGNWSSLAMALTFGISEITITGNNSKATAKEISQKYFLPNKIILESEAINEGDEHFKDKYFGNEPTIYLCKNNSCEKPVTELYHLESLIANKNIF